MMLRKLFGLKKNEMVGGWRNLHNEELHNLYSSTSIIKMTKIRRMRWAGYVAWWGRRGMLIEYWWKSQKEKEYSEDLDVGGRIRLKWILEK
jgi:hypothetical protein